MLSKGSNCHLPSQFTSFHTSLYNWVALCTCLFSGGFTFFAVQKHFNTQTKTCNKSWELLLLTMRLHILVQGILSSGKIHKDMICPTVSLGCSSSKAFTSSTLHFARQAFVSFFSKHYCPPGTEIMSAKWLSQALVNLNGSDFSPWAEMELWHKPGQLSEDDSGDLHVLLTPPLQSPAAATDVWPVVGLSLVILRPALYLAAKTSFNSRQRTSRERRKKEVMCCQNSIPASVLPAEQKVWHAPSCLHLFFFPSSPAAVAWEQSWSHCYRHGLPATGAVSAKINARSVTVLCCNALDSSFLTLPLAALLPTCFLSPLLTCAQSHMRTHCWSLNTNRLSSLKDMIVPLRFGPPLPPSSVF